MTPREARQRIKNVFWTVDEAAEVFGINQRTVRAWTSEGKIESTKLGTRRLIPAHAVLEFFAQALDNPWTRLDTIRILNEHASRFGKAPFDFGVRTNIPKPETAHYAHPVQDEDSDESFADLAIAIRGLQG